MAKDSLDGSSSDFLAIAYIKVITSGCFISIQIYYIFLAFSTFCGKNIFIFVFL